MTEVKTQLYSALYPLLTALYIKPDGSMKIAGDTVQQPDLARTLHSVAKYGPDYVYVTMADTIAKGATHTLAHDSGFSMKNSSRLLVCLFSRF